MILRDEVQWVDPRIRSNVSLSLSLSPLSFEHAVHVSGDFVMCHLGQGTCRKHGRRHIRTVGEEQIGRGEEVSLKSNNPPPRVRKKRTTSMDLPMDRLWTPPSRCASCEPPMSLCYWEPSSWPLMFRSSLVIQACWPLMPPSLSSTPHRSHGLYCRLPTRDPSPDSNLLMSDSRNVS